MKIYLDDKRIPPDETWTLVETLQDFTKLYRETLDVEAISFDHDLGMLSWGDGNDALTFVSELYFLEKRLPPPVMLCHSANPVGRKEIERGIARLQDVVSEGLLDAS